MKIPAATIGARAIPVGKMVRDDKGYYNLYEAISYSIFSTWGSISFFIYAFSSYSGIAGIGASQAAQTIAVLAFTRVQTWQVQSFDGSGGFSSYTTIVPPNIRSIAISSEALLDCIRAFLTILESNPIWTRVPSRSLFGTTLLISSLTYFFYFSLNFSLLFCSYLTSFSGGRTLSAYFKQFFKIL